MRRIIFLSTLIILLGTALTGTAGTARAQAGSSADLIAEVNALRASNGLSPYQVDANLMASAQAHSDYQASINTVTHTRADGSSANNYGFIENIAGGYDLSVSTAVHNFWADDLHMNTMIGISEGYVGAGVAFSGSFVYYTLQVRRQPGSPYTAPVVKPPAGVPLNSTPAASQLIMQVETATPQPDGSVIHEVQSGQSAWSIAIAYNIKIADLIAMNKLPSTPMVFPGQKLLVQVANTPTLTPTVTKTPRPPTRTPTLTRTPRPPTATSTVTPTPTATVFNLLDKLPDLEGGNRRTVGIGLIAVCGIGLLFMVFNAFRKK